jgi:DNA-directed RNA polymerase specialized sigma24 family protein
LPRVTGFDEVYASSRERLLVQLYAYSGDPEAARDALDEAFIAASRRWRRLSSRPEIDGWLRTRAIRRIDGRPRVLREAGASGAPRLLAILATLDPVSRRLLIVRRLDDDIDLPAAAREAGVTDAEAEQALARATTTLHSAGVDTTPAGLGAQLARLSDDLDDRPPTPVGALRRAGARRRFALTALVSTSVAAAVVGAAALVATDPFGDAAGSAPPSSTPTTGPGTTAPPPVSIGTADLLDATVLTGVAPRAGWKALPDPRRSDQPTGTSIYGSCVMAADDPPPETSWIRDFVPAGRAAIPADRPLRQVLLQAPSVAEAQRTFHQLAFSFTSCASRQLVRFQSVSGLGDRARLVALRYSMPGGTVRETVLLIRSGPAVTVLSAKSAPGKPADLSAAAVASVGAHAVANVCTALSSTCAKSPYRLTTLRPPGDGTQGGFLSVVDLPLIPGVSATWAGTNPSTITRNPAATPCDRADFRSAGATGLLSRSFVMPDASKLPDVFGLTETVGRFDDAAAAQAFVAQVTAHVRSCHQRQPTMTVLGSTSFTSHVAQGRAWRVKQQVSPRRAAIFRIAMVRHGATVAQVTFTPVGPYDVKQASYLALAKRAGVRLDS